MNKMHTLAKILITIIVIYWLVTGGVNILQSLCYVFNATPQMQVSFGTSLMVLAVVVIELMVMVILIAVLCKRSKIAERIVGKAEMLSPQSQLDWIPFAFRLISIVAGLYCFRNAIFYLNNLAVSIVYLAHAGDSFVIKSGIPGHCISLLILLFGGIYLFYGAPHFVKWQTRKTIAMCTIAEKDKG